MSLLQIIKPLRFLSLFFTVCLGLFMFLVLRCTAPNKGDTALDSATKNELVSHQDGIGFDKKVAKTIPFDSSITLAYLMGKFDPKKDDRFIAIPTTHADRAGLYLRKETYAAFTEMAAAAKKDSINLTIKSATRNFKYQKGIWERKWTGKTKIDGKDVNDMTLEVADKAGIILRYSSMPGSSRHHWGTDFDLNAFTNSYFEKGQGLKEYEWLSANARKFGFCQPYTPKGKDRPKGYEEEKWHWSFLPLSTTLTEQAGLRIKNKMIQGFEGDDTAPALHIVENYILGINQDCLH